MLVERMGAHWEWYLAAKKAGLRDAGWAASSAEKMGFSLAFQMAESWAQLSVVKLVEKKDAHLACCSAARMVDTMDAGWAACWAAQRVSKMASMRADS